MFDKVRLSFIIVGQILGSIVMSSIRGGGVNEVHGCSINQSKREWKQDLEVLVAMRMNSTRWKAWNGLKS